MSQIDREDKAVELPVMADCQFAALVCGADPYKIVQTHWHASPIEGLLEKLGIGVVHELPGVGGNLQDHLDVCTMTRCTQGLSYDKLSDVSVALQYYLFKSGPGTSNIAEAGGFARSSLATEARADIQFHFVPAMLDDHGRRRLAPATT